MRKRASDSDGSGVTPSLLVETWKAGDDMVVADLDPALLVEATGRKWIRARRPELYSPLAVPTGQECDTRTMKFSE